ncbi:MAG: hypothetical protein J0H09_11645 [Burkholderiales bacterium]|nr:hypothetical protein [Burkholderiales bacterium]
MTHLEPNTVHRLHVRVHASGPLDKEGYERIEDTLSAHGNTNPYFYDVMQRMFTVAAIEVVFAQHAVAYRHLDHEGETHHRAGGLLVPNKP